MPKGTVTEHKDGTVKLTVPFDVAITNYRFFSSEDGAGPAERMVLRKTVANPGESPPGLASFTLTDGDLGIRPDRGSHIRIGTDTGGVFSSKFAEPLTFIAEADNGKTIRAETAAANMDGTVGKGLFDFQQRERTKILRATGKFSVASDYTLTIKDAAGKVSNISSGTAALGFSVPEFFLEPGEKLELVTVTAGTHEAEVTRE